MSDGQELPDDELPRQTGHVVGLVLFALGLTAGFAFLGNYLHGLSGAASYDMRAGAGRARRSEVSALVGRDLFNGRGCLACHMVGDEGSGIRGPNLGARPPQFPEPIAVRAAGAQPGVSAVEHVVQALYEPDAFVAPGFEGGVMLPLHTPPMSLDHLQIRSIVLFIFQTSGIPTTSELTDEILAAQGPWMEGASTDGGAAPGPGVDAGPPALGLLAGDPAAGLAAWQRLRCGSCHEEAPSIGQQDEAASHLAIVSHAGGAGGARPDGEGAPDYSSELTVRVVADLVAYLRSPRDAPGGDE